MIDILTSIALFIAVVLTVLWYLDLLGRQLPPGETAENYERGERSQMPAELASARLVLSEQDIEMERPVRLIARPDQVFLTTDGRHILMETKTRRWHRVFDSDVIELSAQAAILVSRGDRVAQYGYVRSVVKGQPRYHRVALLSLQDVCKLHARYLALLDGKVHPRPPANPGVCRTCPQRAVCPVGRKQ